jgi:hypothetical protein
VKVLVDAVPDRAGNDSERDHLTTGWYTADAEMMQRRLVIRSARITVGFLLHLSAEDLRAALPDAAGAVFDEEPAR